ncbi:MAG TPA: chemoreceptor glutamine deamidase CheD [Ramlibacter sp.]|jgi:chemotaxis protein CheD|uniref:chemoreceptor glutamine deamidase CheD n=1 Tax=Ramlibacter sp. TaxID=1917967 RepID=UPI002D4A87C0|nr:chemoreceptor glutamine deamidase CheD [Ramlibacter sp.]HZY19171.1 chemoreceptor glutamine deamidase CheD [Ramlibacter sp.]
MSTASASAAAAKEQAAALAALRSRPRREHEASFFFWDPAFGSASVKVLPGEFYVHDQDVAITTTLGSCVAACLHDRTAGIGGMNHFMLPDAGDAAAGGRFGAYAMELLINELLKRGARRSALEAKVFGGGQVMKSLAGTLIGEKNVQFVQNFLAQERIPLLGSDVLDIHPRKVCMFPRSGRVLCRRLPAAQLPQTAAQEARYRDELGRQSGGGAVELF